MFWKFGGKRAFAATDAFQRIVHADGIDDGLSGQHAGFARAFVMRPAAPQISRARKPDRSSNSGVGEKVQRMLIVQPHRVGTHRVGDE